ncbi:uncharacterized conserved protein [Moesziomyces antarcticus T-34]|uniref:Uncharacterized conserved protein n=1 Tax=Pseudozyma antarctica (strain T-34) TaxID=1151754 RepID=M9MGW2_PSEA3|nr:uncharacterized conserved protein [Moesziomyces antarcticus T-34]
MVGVGSRFVSEGEASTSTAGANEEYDPRSLFEKLQSQKEAKDAKYDEMYKLSNQFRGIDEGESDFLAHVKHEKAQEEREKRLRETQELEAFRNAQAKPPLPPPVGIADEKQNKTPEAVKDDKVPVKKKRKNDSAAVLGIKRKKSAQVAATGPAKADQPAAGDAKKT